METFFELFLNVRETYAAVYTGFLRYIVPVIGAIILLRCALPLMTFRREPEIWGWLNFKSGEQKPITHWETVIGRSKSCDVTIGFPTVSRNHAVLTRYDDGSWTITDTNSKDGVLVNGELEKICALNDGDSISIGGIKMKLQLISKKQEQLQAVLRSRNINSLDGLANLLLLTVLQIMMALGFLMYGDPVDYPAIMQGFGAIIILQWLLLIFYGIIRRSSFDLETLAFFLCTMGMAAILTVKPSESMKQAFALGIGILMYLVIGWFLRDLERAKRFRYLAVIAGVGFLAVTLVFGTSYYGARNWIVLGGVSLQPSELSKVCFVFAGTSTMDRIMNKRNLILFIAYSVIICALLAVMNDFGTALVFFCSFLIIAYLRSGSMGTVALAVTSLVVAGILAMRVAPHALKRFAAWRHVWENPLSSGYQQTRAMMCIAAGGLFGLGPGRGWLQKLFAADSDIVFATISEEWGLIVAVMLVLCIAAIGMFAIRSSRVARSSFYSIGSCTAACILLIQTILNFLGTVDILPFTGVTFPFLSNGGTSMIGAWALLSFVKASDTRQNASFAVKLTQKGRSGK